MCTSIQRYNSVDNTSTEYGSSTVDAAFKKEWKADYTDNRIHCSLPDDIRKPVFRRIQ